MGSRSFYTESIAFNSIPCILKQTHVQERVTWRKVERYMNVLYGKETTWDFCFSVWKATVKKWHLPKKIRMRTMSLNCRRKILLDRSRTTVTELSKKKWTASCNCEHWSREWMSVPGKATQLCSAQPALMDIMDMMAPG